MIIIIILPLIISNYFLLLPYSPQGLSFRVLSFNDNIDWEALVLEKENSFTAKDTRTLVTVPHGGPHSAFATEFIPIYGKWRHLIGSENEDIC